ncbi:unnamed protein product [Dracunculus medinensis]|uniref:Cytochrome c oxidase subunit 1 n=1 Tax=Dracunculus medinensis TaxID=318479 RepID=A0A3P7SY45_DRAME|nr:unnamed protein product [Dracunculus medinensis]
MGVVLHGTYYVVSHFHYVLRIGAVFGIFCGINLWWTFLTGFIYDKIFMSMVFLVVFVGANLTFFLYILLVCMVFLVNMLIIPIFTLFGMLFLLMVLC